MTIKNHLLIWMLALFAGCASPPASTDAARSVQFVVVRHAEKAADGTDDPPLTEAGRARAASLADSLRTRPLRAVYATGFQRTQQTAAPAARVHGLRVASYDAKQPAMELAAGLRRTHSTGTVLVVGHSNTVPAIVAALCACAVAPMSEHEYDRLSIVRIDAGGRAQLEQRRY